jgi:hypothetical protein
MNGIKSSSAAKRAPGAEIIAMLGTPRSEALLRLAGSLGATAIICQAVAIDDFDQYSAGFRVFAPKRSRSMIRAPRSPRSHIGNEELKQPLQLFRHRQSRYLSKERVTTSTESIGKLTVVQLGNGVWNPVQEYRIQIVKTCD